MANNPDPVKARQELIERLERSFSRFASDQGPLGTPASGLEKLRSLQELIERLKQGPQQAPSPPRPHPDQLTISWQEYEAIFSFYEDAIDAIQLARYSVRFQRPMAAEPAYPRESAMVLAMLRRLMDELKEKNG